MTARAGWVLLLAGIAAAAGPIGTAIAQDDPIKDAACEMVKDHVIEEIFSTALENGGVPKSSIVLGQNAFDAWTAYMTSNDGEKLNAAAASLTRSGLNALFPAAGVGFDVSEAYINGVKITINEAEKLRMQNFICGGSDFFDYPNNDFWGMAGVQQIAPGVTCENFAERVVRYEQIMQLKALWEGEHSRRVKIFQHDSQETRDRLGQAWYVLQQQWAAKWAEGEYRRIRSELFRHSAGRAGQAGRCSTGTQQVAQGGAGSQVAQGSAGDALGSVWDESESGWRGQWVRQGTSNKFDASWGGGSVKAVLTITISGNSVSVSRVNATDGNNCQYKGTLTGSSVKGTYTCTSGGGDWSATIR